MRARGAAVQGVLAGVALIAAYLTWQREPERAQGEVVIVDVSRGELQKVRFDDGVKWVELRRDGETTWVRHGSRPPPARADAAADGGTAADAGTPGADAGVRVDAGVSADGGTGAAPPAVIADREVKGNEAAARLFERFAPLRATRALGALAPEKRKELGLTDTPRTLTLTADGSPRTFKVSATSALLAAPYLLDARDERVYLVSSSLIADLEGAPSRSVDRRLHAFAEPEYDTATVRLGGAERAFVQTGASVQDLAIAPKASPDRPDEFARNWLHRVFALVPMEVLGRDELPAAGAPVVEGRVEYARDGKPLGFIELARGAQNHLFVRTEHTAGWVRVQIGATELVTDGKRIVSGT